MKREWLCIIVVLYTSFGIQAQSKKDLSDMLSRDLAAYRRYSLALNLDSSLQFMPPKMFEIVPLDSLKSNMKQSVDNQFMRIEMTGFDFDTVNQPALKKAGDYYWTLVRYTGSMRLFFKGDKKLNALLIPLLKSQFGEENIQMEGDTAMQLALKNKQLLAYKDPALSNWSMIEDKRSDKGREGAKQKQLFNAILPKEVLNALDNE